MNLNKIQFLSFESKKKYLLSSFDEQGIKVTILNEDVVSNKIPSGNFYKFGVIENGIYYWFFNGEKVANSRNEMIEIFKALLIVYKDSECQPFIYKVKRI